MTDQSLDTLRHSASHILASAVVELFPGTKLGIGPAIEDGFYYDFEVPRPLTPDDLPVIEERMKEIAGRNLPFVRRELSRDEALELFGGRGEVYKTELIQQLPPDEPITVYSHGDFTDLCRGPHVNYSSKVKHFKLLSIAGAYWRGDEKRPQLQRIYGTAFATKEELAAHLQKLEEIRKRDHRKLGRELGLFEIFEDEFGPGLVFWLPKGAIVRTIIENYLKEFLFRNGYQMLVTPHIAKSDLWRTSGHLSFYRENMYSPMKVDDVEYLIKPMNCPGHVLVYRSAIRSYRELPLRYFEFGTVYRYERSGVLHGLFRVRGFTQDDAHIFCTPEQLGAELIKLIDDVVAVLRRFGFDAFDVTLSTRPADAIGEPRVWELAEGALRAALEARSLAYMVDEGGGAFYGPKIDIKIKDALGRSWQCSTIQVDFNLPQRFDVRYRTAEGKDEHAIMIHRALLGSLERFFGVLIEHYAGAFPLWLAPVQTAVLPVSDRTLAYAESVRDRLVAAGVRTSVDSSAERLPHKIREAAVQKVPFILVVGEREAAAGTVALRSWNNPATEILGVDDVIRRLREEPH
jgi:threonyl-tRNA synthetase